MWESCPQGIEGFLQSTVHRDMGIGAACGLSSTLLVGVENAFKTNLPGVTRRAVLFHLSVVMMMGSFAAGAAASSFQLIRQGPEISAMMFVTYLSFVSHVSLAKQVRLFSPVHLRRRCD